MLLSPNTARQPGGGGGELLAGRGGEGTVMLSSNTARLPGGGGGALLAGRGGGGDRGDWGLGLLDSTINLGHIISMIFACKRNLV